MCAGCAGPCSGGLEQKAPEEQDAQDYQDRDDDDLNETHGRFLASGKPNYLGGNSSRVNGLCQWGPYLRAVRAE